jgi:hypothetical protein
LRGFNEERYENVKIGDLKIESKESEAKHKGLQTKSVC